MSSAADLLDIATDPDRYYPIHYLITSYLSVKDILSVRRVSKKYSTYFHTAIRSQWNINVALKPFFRDPTAFRILQASTNTLIGGYFARDFFMRRQPCSLTSPTRIALSLYAQRGTGSADIQSYIESEGYVSKEFVPTGNQWLQDSDHSMFDLNITEGKVILFQKRTSWNGKRVGIMLHLTADPPLYTLLRTTTCTSLKNVITWNKAYCLFPNAMLLKHDSYLTIAVTSEMQAVLQEIFKGESEAGLKLKNAHFDELVPSHSKDRASLLSSRLLTDKYSWTIDLDTSGINTIAVPSFVYDCAGFRLERNRLGDASSMTVRFRAECSYFTSPVLKYTYVYDTPQVPGSFGSHISRLKDKLNQLTLIGLVALKPEDRPVPGYDTVVDNLDLADVVKGKFAIPDWWNYYDEDVAAALVRIGSSKNDKFHATGIRSDPIASRWPEFY